MILFINFIWLFIISESKNNEFKCSTIKLQTKIKDDMIDCSVFTV